MARLTNIQSGVTVEVSDEIAGALGAGWESDSSGPKANAKAAPKASPRTASKD